MLSPRVSSTATTLARMRELFRDIDGFDIDEAEEDRLEEKHGSLTYGEIMPTAGVRLIDTLELGEDDVFVDFGSGVGRLLLTAALRSPVRRVVGVELLRDRHVAATRAVDGAVARGWVESSRVELRNEDILETSLAEATVFYTCSTAFPDELTLALAARVAGLKRATLFVTTQEVEEGPRMRLRRTLRLDMSWSRSSRVHIYDAGPL